MSSHEAAWAWAGQVAVWQPFHDGEGRRFMCFLPTVPVTLHSWCWGGGLAAFRRCGTIAVGVRCAGTVVIHFVCVEVFRVHGYSVD